MTPDPTLSVPAAWHAIPRMVSDISEEFYCAGWLIDCEFSVWRMIQEGGRWGMGAAGDIPETLGALKSIAEQTGHWVRWDEDATPPTQPVPLDEWEPIYAEWAMRRQLALDAAEAKRCKANIAPGVGCGLDTGHDGPHFRHYIEYLNWRREQRELNGG